MLNQFVTKVKDKNVLLTAPTGIAALNINGATLHRTFHLATDIVRLAQDPTEDSISDVVKKTDILIIDEISMCRLDVFEKVLKSSVNVGQDRQSASPAFCLVSEKLDFFRNITLCNKISSNPCPCRVF